MKRIIAAIFGLTIAAAVLTAPPAMAADVQVAGYVINQEGIYIKKGELAFYASCQDFENGNPVATVQFDNPVPLYQVTLPTGLYLVRIAPEPGSFGLTSWNAGSLTCEGAAAIDVKPGSTFHDVTARNGTLTQGGVESDRGDGVSIGDVSFYASCKDFRNFEPAGSAMIDNAAYQVTLPAGTYRALIEPGSGQGSTVSWHNAKLSCAAADVITVPEISFSQGAPLPFTADLKSLGVTEVSGTADSPKGSILYGDIQFYASCDAYQDGNPIASAPIDNGTYSAEVPAGTYRVRIVPFDTSGALKSWHDNAANCATSSAVTINPDPSQTLALHALAGVVLTGSVTSSNGSVTSGSIDFYKTCSGRSYFTSIDNGSYTVVVPSGNYRAFISADTGTGAVNSWHSNAQSCADAQVVDAAANGTRNLVAKAGFAVSGTVSGSKGSIADGSVTFFRTCDDANSGDSVGSSSLNAGVYNTNLPNGTYRAFIEPDRGQGALESWHNAAMSCEQAATVTVNGPTTANLTAVAGSNVTGSVSNGSGQLSDGNVWFYADCEADEEGDLVARGDFDPNYSLTVPNGTYRVLITPSSAQQAVDSWHSAKPSCDQATPVTVSGDGTINLVATRGAQIGGDVTSSAGPVAEGSIEFYTDCEAFKNENPTSRVKISSGTYSLTVPNGSYRVRIYTKGSGDPAFSWHSAKNTCAEANVVNVTGDNSNVDIVAKLGSPVEGIVTRNGTLVRFGDVSFYATCNDFLSGQEAARGSIVDGFYTTALLDGTYYARIRQSAGFGVSYSWHNAAGSCALASQASVSGPTPARPHHPADVLHQRHCERAIRAVGGRLRAVLRDLHRLPAGQPGGRAVVRGRRVRGPPARRHLPRAHRPVPERRCPLLAQRQELVRAGHRHHDLGLCHAQPRRGRRLVGVRNREQHRRFGQGWGPRLLPHVRRRALQARGGDSADPQQRLLLAHRARHVPRGDRPEQRIRRKVLLALGQGVLR